jgi:predicted protein tyrosine phosphatase
VSAVDVAWADAIFAMERAQQDVLAERFEAELRGKAVHVLDIPDAYAAMDPELVELLRASVPPLHELW